MTEFPAAVIVVLTGLYFCALAAASLIVPVRAKRFLLGLASSRPIHYFELFIRILAGASFVTYAPHMSFPAAFSLFGWILVVTTVGLLSLPWRWHHQFAQIAVPRAVHHLPLIGLCSLVFGGLILAAAIPGGIS